MKYNVEIDGLGVEANYSEESIEMIFLPLLERLTKMRAEKNRRKSRVFLENKGNGDFPPFPFKRREWDSNPRALADKRFSRPPRYDHFDISPYVHFLKA